MKKKFSKILGVGLTLALLTSLLMTAAPVSALSQPLVSFATTADAVISEANADISIRFELGKELGTTDEIVITFPSDTTVFTGAMAGATIVASQGWIGTPATWKTAHTTGAVTITGDATARTVTVELDDALNEIGEGAQVRINLPAGITNPSAVGAYTLTVGTQDATATPVVIEAAVTSAAYSITAPTISALPGIVSVYNPADILMNTFTGDTAIKDAIAVTGVDYTVKIGPGTYNLVGSDLFTTKTGATGVTFIASGATAETIYEGNVVINEEDITIDGLTIEGDITVTDDDAIITRCVLLTDDTATILVIANAGGTDLHVENCIIDVTGTTTVLGIDVNEVDATISGNTFTVDAGGAAIDIAAGDATYPTTVTLNTITGSSGLGVEVTATSVSNITTNTFSGLTTAIDVTATPTAAPTVTIDGNTITNCGYYSTTTTNPAIAVDVDGGEIAIKNNTISTSPDDILVITDGADVTYVLFNDLSGNVKGIENNDGTIIVNATHNWWGAATGPASGFNSTYVDASGYLGANATGVFNVNAASLTAKTTASVDIAATVAATLDNPAIMGAANYAANPQDAPPYAAIADGFFDVFVSDVDILGAAHDATEILIKLYNANITADTMAYAWSVLQGGWSQCTSQGVNLFGGYVWVRVTDASIPEITDLAGTPFALVEVPAGAIAAPAIAAPVSGAEDVSLTPTLAWGTIAGAIGYDFELADNPLFVAPMVKLTGDLARLIVPFYQQPAELDYSTYYYWRVKAVSATAESAWSAGVFLTVAEVIPEPEPEPEPRMWTCPQCGLTYSTRAKLEAHAAWAHKPVEQPDIIIEPEVEVIVPLPAETPITPAWIYVIIGVGAVLVIALIVLIVRTRRVA